MISVLSFTIMLSEVLVVVLMVVSVNATFMVQISGSEITNKYPNVDQFDYAINFNTSIMQANYVYYRSPSEENNCNKSSPKWEPDSYGISDIVNKDYDCCTKTYDRGHLVPGTDHGCGTWNLSNATPMTINFNRGSWNKNEKELRNKFPNHLFIKGCLYSDKYEMGKAGHKLYIPSGCYWIVCDGAITSIDMIGIRSSITCGAIDYGYLSQNGTGTKVLPWWASPVHSASSKNNYWLPVTISMSIGVPILAGIAGAAGVIVYRKRRNIAFTRIPGVEEI